MGKGFVRIVPHWLLTVTAAWNTVDSVTKNLRVKSVRCIVTVPTCGRKSGPSFLPEQIIHQNHFLDAAAVHIVF